VLEISVHLDDVDRAEGQCPLKTIDTGRAETRFLWAVRDVDRDPPGVALIQRLGQSSGAIGRCARNGADDR
jgi:hypothetical protein